MSRMREENQANMYRVEENIYFLFSCSATLKRRKWLFTIYKFDRSSLQFEFMCIFTNCRLTLISV